MAIFRTIPLSKIPRAVWLLLILVCFAPNASAAISLQQIPTVLHAHTNWSTGALSLDEMVARSQELGIGAVFLAENHLQEFEYGLFPLRGLLRYRIQYPSVAEKGAANFLRAVTEANAKQKDVLIVPGAEVIPHYYWTGHLFQNTLTMYNAQKNILALGLSRPADYEEMPVTGNYGASRWGLATLWLLSPAILAIPGIFLLRTKRRRVVKTQFFNLVEERRLLVPGLLCLGIAIVLLINNYPFRYAPQSMYDSDAGLRPHQEVIDFVASRGGVAVWSMPEAKDHQVATVWKLQATVHTDPYPSDLLRTDRFAAFGGIYEDTTTFTEPGKGWDQLLRDYLEGRRKAPAWAIAEAAYHYEDQAGKKFGEIQTVLLAERKDQSALLGALQSGRAYALRRNRQEGLVLNQFQVIVPLREPVEAGSEVVLRSTDRPELQIAITSSSGRPVQIGVSVIRSGVIVHTTQGNTPLTLRWADPSPPSNSRHYYRIDVRAPGHQILSNPVFVNFKA
jgi:hypothetical protein